MPIYDMKCEKCGHQFDDWRGANAPKPECPKCGGPTRNIIHAPRVTFKGSGFYETDYKGKK